MKSALPRPLRPSDAKPMTESERADFEVAVLDDTRSICRHIETTVPGERRRTRNVRLDGEYPDTTVFVEWDDFLDRKTRSASYPIWRERSFRTADGRMAPTEHVGNLIATWVHET